MSRLIDELKQEHQALAEILNSVKELGITSTEAQEKLLEAKNAFIAHLKKEDDQLYPFLRKEAESNKNLKETLDIFASSMDEISKAAIIFFDKYAHGGSNMEFARDFGTLFSTLNTRIRREENNIYKKYDELH